MSEAVYADAPLPLDAVPVQFQRNVDPNSPPPMRLMAAQGLVPMPPVAMVTALYMLAADPDERVAATARNTLQDLPPDIMQPALADKLDIRVLDSLAQRFINRPEYIDAIVMNAGAADETVHWITTKAKERQLELIANNQVRLLRHPKIIEALYLNPATRMSTVDRVIDFAVRAGVYLEGISAFEEAAKALGLEAPEKGRPPPVVPEGLELAEDPAVAAAAVAEADPDDSIFADFLDQSLQAEEEGRTDLSDRSDLSDLEREFGEGEAPTEAAGSDLEGYQSDAKAEEQEEQVKRGRSSEIAKMKISQKVRLALLGTKTDRGILIRDRNRLVCMSVIKSPKIQVQEAVGYAAMRNISDDVIRYISTRRQWLKSYQMKLALARNPKTPVGTALKLLPFMRKGDLRGLAADKNVSNTISGQAKRMLRG